jgi:hypothetical protein
MTALTTSPRIADTTLAMIRMSTRGFARKPSSSPTTAPRRRPVGSFGPTRSRRRRASLLPRPSADDSSRPRSTSRDTTAGDIAMPEDAERMVAA